VVYLNGYVKVQDYMENGGDLKDLYMWKVKISDIEEIKESWLVKINSDDLKVPFFS
jgi:hypothetical protein